MARRLLASVVAAVFLASFAWAAPVEKGQLPGRQIRVSAICIGFGGDHDSKLEMAVRHLHVAGKNDVDIACLPEEFDGTIAETVPGPTTNAVAKLAKQYNMYVICPIREQAGDQQYNTAVLIDRKGQIAGCYRKVFVFWGEGLHCSTEGVKFFDTDFGRISILTCFDLNFPELWQQCNDADVDVVFWPSAYGGGMPLNAYAMLYHYYIVPVGWGNIVDITGNNIKSVDKPLDKQFIVTIDLDRTFVHKDFNRARVDKLLKENEGKVALEHEYEMDGWWLLKSLKPGVRVRDLLEKYQIEPLRQYRQRSRKQINQARKEGKRI